MNDFRHVPPFTPAAPGSGLRDLNDLASTLPNQPQSAPTHPARTPSDSIRVDLPKIPKPPLQPQTLTQASWTYYLAQMTAYMAAWNTFNVAMANQSLSRATQQADRMKSGGGMVDGWLGVLGETMELVGWDGYKRGLKEDERIRIHGNVALERHVAAVEMHDKLRARIQVGGLPG